MEAIEIRLSELCADLGNDMDWVFVQLCKEFELDPKFYESELGCTCPYGLVGYVLAGDSEVG
jgi:hypothetical protein